MSTILIIDDNPAVATALDVLFSIHDLRTVAAATPGEGLALAASGEVGLAIQDMNFSADTTSGQEGVTLFHALREVRPELPIILLTAWTQLETAVELVRLGAADYLAKPWDDNKLIATVKNLLALSESQTELRRRRSIEAGRQGALAQKFDLCGLVYADAAMERAVSLACEVARAEVSVLIRGPNGAGKEKIAEIVQANSSTRDGAFVTLNCGALPAELLEAELFGVEAGAYTGATRSREGKFEAANGGTLFLDEIGNLSLGGQMKLLRVLETGRFERLGSNETIAVSVRVVSATNADLRERIADGTFREDLYYRLNTIEITVPPLVERPDDIEPLAEHFLGQGGKPLADDARRALRRHNWPGNVRELKNALQRAELLSRDEVIVAADLGLSAPPRRGSGASDMSQRAIEAALAEARGVIAQAASELGISRQALYRRMDKLGIARK